MTSVKILNDEQKQAIINEFLSRGVTKAQLARDYGVSERTIGRIINGESRARSVNDEDEEYNYNFVCSPTTITISRSTSKTGESATITSEDGRFTKIFNDLIVGQFSTSHLEKAFNLINKKAQIEKLSFGNITVDQEVGSIVYTYPGSEDTIKFSPKLTNRLIYTIRSNGVDSVEFTSLLKFVDRLAWNPDPKMIEQVYDFIIAKDIEITEEGYVKAYKKVAPDFKDLYTGKIDNSPGCKVKVKRSFVDADPNVTCSHGLHVCSWAYLSHYGTASSNVVVECIIDPKDFVSIPYDYYQTYENESVPAKARVCEYYVTQKIDYTHDSTPKAYYDNIDDDDNTDYETDDDDFF